MLQQTTIAAATPKYLNFIEKLPSLTDLAAASEAELRPLVQGLGYYRRFALLHRAAKQLVAGPLVAEPMVAGPMVAGARRSGQARATIPWPTTYAGWRKLPGVGDYTAAAVSSLAFGAQHVALDGNGERILTRLLASREPLTAKAKGLLKGFAADLLGSAPAAAFNEALMELGQKVCIRKRPRCQLCPVTAYCQAYALSAQDDIPTPAPKRAPVAVTLAMVVPKLGSSLGLLTRGSKAKFLKNQLGFATCIANPAGLELDGSKDTLAAKALGELLASPWPRQVIGSFRHAITHHKILAKVHLIELAESQSQSQSQKESLVAAGFEFIERSNIRPRLAASLDLKTLNQLESCLDIPRPHRKERS